MTTQNQWLPAFVQRSCFRAPQRFRSGAARAAATGGDMFRTSVVAASFSRVGKWAVLPVILCLFAFARPAVADPIDVVTLHFTAQVVCDVDSEAICGTSTATVTGVYSYDVDKHSIVGSWSFKTPVGTLSSANPGSLGDEPCTIGGPPLQCQFGLVIPAISADIFVRLFLGFSDTTDAAAGGPLQIGVFSFLNLTDCPVTDPQCLPSQALGGQTWDFTSYSFTSSPASAPEPSSFLLLGTGLVAVGGVFCRRAFGMRQSERRYV